MLDVELGGPVDQCFMSKGLFTPKTRVFSAAEILLRKKTRVLV